jgi:hypothetical protein
VNLDRDLRDALQLLAGDPVADATRVLAALPPGGPGAPRDAGRRPLPPVSWWLLALGLAVGLAVGFAAGAFLNRGAEAPKQEAPRQDEPKPEPKPEPKAEPQPEPKKEAPHLMLMAYGMLSIDEPGVGVQELEPGNYMSAMGTRCTTRDGLAGVYVSTNGSYARLGPKSTATIGGDGIAFAGGRLFVHRGSERTVVTVDAGLADVQVEGAALLTKIKDVDGDRLTVLALDGDTTLRTIRGESAHLLRETQVTITRERGLGRIENVPFVGAATGWMTPLILLQHDPAELWKRIEAMASAYVGGEHRSEAATELRRLGSHAVPRVAKLLQERAGDTAFARECARLLADIADHGRAMWLLPLLEYDDQEIRAIAFGGLVRATGTTVKDEEFWRVADLASRQAAIDVWREQLR